MAVRLLSEYGDRAALFDTSAPLADQELVARARQQQFYTVLLADDSPLTAPDSLAESLRALRDPVRRRAVRTARGLQHRGRHHRGRAQRRDPGRDHPPGPAAAVARPAAVDDALLGTSHRATDAPIAATTGSSAAEWIRELRPHIDLYLLTDESIAARGRRRVRRLRPHLLPAQRRHRPVQHAAGGDPRRVSQHRFSTHCAPTPQSPVGQFHALPVARGASIFNSKIAARHGRVLRPQHLHGRDVDDLRWAGLAAGSARHTQAGDGQGGA